MSDDLHNRGPQDRSRISLSEKWEVQYWTKELGVSKEELEQAVKTAGNSVNAVRQHLTSHRH
jgi:ribonuclease PH